MILWIIYGAFFGAVFSSLLFCDYWEKEAEIGMKPEDHFPHGLGIILIAVIVISAIPLANIAAIYLFIKGGIQARKEYYQRIMYEIMAESPKIEKTLIPYRLENKIYDRITIDKESVKKLSPLAQRSLNYILEDLENVKKTEQNK